MAAAFRDVQFVNQANVSSVTVTKPIGTVSGDLLIAHIAGRFYSGQGVTAPAGWTIVIDERHTGGVWECYTAYKIAGGGEPANYEFTFATAWAGGAIWGFSSTSSAAPLASSGQGTDTAMVMGSITPGANSVFLILTGWGDVVSSVSGYAMTTSDPGTWTEKYDHQAGGGGGGGFSGAYSAVRSQATATGNITATLANSQIYADVSIAIAPVAAAAVIPNHLMMMGVS